MKLLTCGLLVASADFGLFAVATLTDRPSHGGRTALDPPSYGGDAAHQLHRRSSLRYQRISPGPRTSASDLETDPTFYLQQAHAKFASARRAMQAVRAQTDAAHHAAQKQHEAHAPSNGLNGFASTSQTEHPMLAPEREIAAACAKRLRSGPELGHLDAQLTWVEHYLTGLRKSLRGERDVKEKLRMEADARALHVMVELKRDEERLLQKLVRTGKPVKGLTL